MQDRAARGGDRAELRLGLQPDEVAVAVTISVDAANTGESSPTEDHVLVVREVGDLQVAAQEHREEHTPPVGEQDLAMPVLVRIDYPEDATNDRTFAVDGKLRAHARTRHHPVDPVA